MSNNRDQEDDESHHQSGLSQGTIVSSAAIGDITDGAVVDSTVTLNSLARGEATQAALQRNILLLRLFRPLLLSNAAIVPGLVPFFTEHGLSLTQIALLQAAFGLSLIWVELLTSALSDNRGRREILLFGSMLLVGAEASYALASGWIGFLLAEILLGIGYSLVSGVDRALLEESLRATNHQGEVQRELGWISHLEAWYVVVAFLIGGFLAEHVSTQAPFIFGVIMFCGLVVVSLLFCEPPADFRRKGQEHVNTQCWRSLWRRQRRAVKRIVVTKAVIIGAVSSPVWLYLVYLEASGLDVFGVGVSFALMSLVSGLAAARGARLRRNLSIRSYTRWSLLAFAASCLVLGADVSIISALFILVHQVLRGLDRVLFADTISQRIHEGRATVFSVSSAISRLVLVLLMVPTMTIAQYVSLQASFIALGVAAIALMLGLSILPVWTDKTARKYLSKC